MDAVVDSRRHQDGLSRSSRSRRVIIGTAPVSAVD
jgi:hypothetical protein